MISQMNQAWIQANLSASSQIDGAFVLGYRITGGGTNDWSARFNRFKFGNQRSRVAGIAVMQAALGVLMRRLFASSGIAAHEVTFVPALGSAETTANPAGPISNLVRACASVFGNPVSINLLSKRPHERLHSPGRTADARAKIIRNAGYQATRVQARAVLVFDDFITRGDTLGAIANAIKATNPKVSVYGVAFAQNQGIDFIDAATANDHLLPALAGFWDKHERA